ncbi:F-box only protein 42 [Mortierella sp. GBA43]|nr:F-box only protein 42 [Mortierella sp. GBA43]
MALVLFSVSHQHSSLVSTACAQTVSPTWRAFHAAAIVGDSMIVFGGTSSPTQNPYGSTVPGSSDVWAWSTTLRQWSRPSISTALSPFPQKFLSAVTLPSQGKMMAFVSNSTTGSTQGNLLILDTLFWTWSIPDSPNSGVAPASRLGAAVGMADNTIYIHGGASVSSFNGYSSSSVLNDLTKLDQSTFEWTSIANGPALMYHTMCRLTGPNVMAVFGGSDTSSNAFNDVHMYDLTKQTWSLNVQVNVGTGGSMPSSRKGHTAVCNGNSMIVFGGGVDSPVDDSVWVMDASSTPWVWNRMTTNQQLGPGPRTGHSALLNGTNMLVWGGYGSPLAGDTNIYILDTVNWQWSSSKDTRGSSAAPGIAPDNGSGVGKNSLTVIIGVVCGALALVVAFAGYIILRRRASRKSMNQKKTLKDNASYLSDAEQHLSGDMGLDDKPSYYHHQGRDSGSSLGGWPSIAARRNITPTSSQGYPLRSLSSSASQQVTNDAGSATNQRDGTPSASGAAASTSTAIAAAAAAAGATTRTGKGGSLAVDPPRSSRSVDFAHLAAPPARISQGDGDQGSQRGARAGSIASDPYYPAHLAEHDEEDADRWTFASSLSFDQRDKAGVVPTLRYIPTSTTAPATPTRNSAVAGLPRNMMQSTGSLTPTFSPTRVPRRDTSAPSILSVSAQGSPMGPTPVSLSGKSGMAPPLSREGSISPRDAALFNSVSPLDRVSLMCSGLDMEPGGDEDPTGGALSAAHLHSKNNLAQWRESYQRESFIHTPPPPPVDEEEEEDEKLASLQRSASTSTGHSSTAYTTLDHPAMVTLIQNLPARYKVTKSPSPIHGPVNDILFAVDSDTQQPIVIKSFARREAWERECRMLRRLRGPCVVELKHVATLVLSETDDPEKPAKIRLTILERLDETLAQMLKNARKAKKLALREQASSSPSSAPSPSPDSDPKGQEEQGMALDLSGAGLYRSGSALDPGYIKDIAKGVLRCLTWCHAKKVVYCDLKPTNVMRNRDDPRQVWKLIDLEASRTAEEERTSMGTARYCPPEVAKAVRAETQGGRGRASVGVTAQYSMDLWAFGCLLYELFATRPLIPMSATDDAVLDFLANPSPSTPAFSNGLRWRSAEELEIPYFEEAVQDSSARQLIRILLHPDPRRRATMNQLLSSDYLGDNQSA